MFIMFVLVVKLIKSLSFYCLRCYNYQSRGGAPLAQCQTLDCKVAGSNLTRGAVFCPRDRDGVMECITIFKIMGSNV